MNRPYRLLLLAIAAALFVSLAADSAQAQYRFPWRQDRAFNFLLHPYTMDYIPAPPYYAVYPPTYFGLRGSTTQPVPRPITGPVAAPARRRPQPQIVINQYLDADSEQPQSSAPRIIVNPYFDAPSPEPSNPNPSLPPAKANDDSQAEKLPTPPPVDQSNLSRPARRVLQRVASRAGRSSRR